LLNRRLKKIVQEASNIFGGLRANCNNVEGEAQLKAQLARAAFPRGCYA